MGEKEFKKRVLVKTVAGAVQEMASSSEELHLSTPGGRFHVRWDEGGSATAMGQLAFFAEFLEASGLFTRWVDGCPLTYTNPNVMCQHSTGHMFKQHFAATRSLRVIYIH